MGLLSKKITNVTLKTKCIRKDSGGDDSFSVEFNHNDKLYETISNEYQELLKKWELGRDTSKGVNFYIQLDVNTYKRNILSGKESCVSQSSSGTSLFLKEKEFSKIDKDINLMLANIFVKK